MNKHKILTLLVALALALAFVLPGARQAQAAAPANDDFDQAIAIGSLPYADTQDISQAITAWDDPWTWCWGTPQATIWYAYTPAESRLLRMDNLGSGNSTVISVYTGSRGSLNQVSCTGGQNVTLDLYAQGGVAYYFMISMSGGMYPYPDPGQAYISVFNLSEVAPSPNDDFANAMLIGSLNFTNDVDINPATTQTNEPSPSCGKDWYSANRTVWYAYTPDKSGSLMAHSSSWMSTFWAVYTGLELASLHELACGSYGDWSAFQVDGGVTYYIQAGSMYNEGGWLTFQLDVAPPPTVDFYYSPWDPSIYDDISFWDITYDPANADIASWLWYFGDGGTSQDYSVTHRYTRDGDYLVTHGATTTDGRTASIDKWVSVKTHDVAITKFGVPKSASAGQTRTITVGLKNLRYAESVTVELYRSSPYGYQWVGSLNMSVPVRAGNRTTDFLFSYTFTSEDAKMGKVTFKAVADIQNARDALYSDNEAISMPVKVSR